MQPSRRPAARSALVLGARLTGAGIVFATQAAIARAWGPAALGHYLLILATVNLTAFAMPLGFNVIGSYFAAAYAVRASRRNLMTFLLRAWLNVALAAAGLVLLWPLLPMLPGQPFAALHDLWLPAAVLATAMAVVLVNGSVLVGLASPLAGFAGDVVLRPLVLMAAFLAVLAFEDPGAQVGLLIRLAAPVYAGVALVHAAIALVAVRRLTDGVDVPEQGEARRWWRFAPPWVLIALFTDFYFDIDLVLLSHLLSGEELAVFGVCARIYALVAFGVGAVYAVAMPAIVAAEAQSDPSLFTRKVTEANILAAAFAAAACAGSIALGPFGLRVFGEGFVTGAAPLALMCFGLTVRAAMGPASLVLSIHDRPYASLPAIGLGLAALVAGNAMLVPSHGIMGAAIAAVASMTIWSVALWLTALRCTSLDVSIFPRLRGALRS